MFLTTLDIRRGLGLLVLAALSGACSAGDYWLGGSSGQGGASGGASAVLTGDWPLVGSDDVEIGGTTPCRILGNGHGIVSQGPFSGRLHIHDCDFVGLGSVDAPAIAVEVAEPGSLVIERSTFSRSGGIELTNDDNTTTIFRDNVIFEDAALRLDPASDAATPAFKARGQSPAQKLFQGNRVYRGGLWLESSGWLVGGSTDAESNVLIGLRAGVEVAAAGIVVRGNYVHDEHLTGAGDESCIATDYSVSDALAEHNVLRRGTWVVRGFGGEFRYNAVLDADNLAFVQQPFEGTRLHHNLFVMCSPASGGAQIQGGIELVNARASGIEIFNNTFDGGGTAIRFGGPAVSIESGSFLDSLRSNLITSFWLSANAGDAVVRPGPTEGSSAMAVRLGYADYNLFDNVNEATLRNYGVSVAGLRERSDAGFALNDALPGGSIDQQIGPSLTAAGACVPMSDDDFRAGRITVSQVLAAFRAAYTPLAESPALAGGDPQDGAGNFIGAVGDGTLAGDRFGRFGDAVP